MTPPAMTPEVASVFAGYPDDVRERLVELRSVVYAVAAETEGVGELEEALRWGQPSYLTSATRSGSTLRIDAVRSVPGRYAMYTICHTRLVERFRQLFPDELRYEGDRAVVFDGPVPDADPLRECIAMTLTYHRDRRRGSARPASGGSRGGRHDPMKKHPAS